MNNYENLQKILKEIFEMDKADLDFGIYRIMNQKREQVMDFIDRRLPRDIKDILVQTQSKDSTSIQAELDKAIKSVQDLGVDPEALPKVIELKAQLNNAIDTNTLEQEVFSHLANFFKRYYKDGDFISLRRYKKDVYAIPYEGEEVKLHWANHDQYYIKTSEYLKNYSFKLKDGKSVHFQLKEASTEQNNNKSQGDQERRFAIYEELPVEVIDGQLYINFTYEPHKKTVKQAELEAKAIEVIQNNIPAEFTLAFDKAPTEKNKNRTIVEKHLNDFISRNSFDYFIHKDLGGFLSRELDFYIKNEVLYIDDINTENPAYFTAQLSKIKALKTVASKIITFLAQIEDFQKKLWLKKKFVISTNYCITLDRIPENYYAEIVANQAQINEWKEMFEVVIPNGSKESLRNEPYLVVDTKHFSEEFKDKLLAEFENLDEETNGLLINSENFQALNVMQEKYQAKINGIYIDPPYNTGSDGFVYKDGFSHSSWNTMMYDRMYLAKLLGKKNSAICISINNKENLNSQKILESIYDKFENSFTIKVRHENRIIRKDIRYQDCIEYLNIAGNEDFTPNRILKEGVNKEDEYLYEIIETGKHDEILDLGNYKIEVFKNNSYVINKKSPTKNNLKRYTIRGSLITQKGSASEFYEIYLRSRREIDGHGTLYKLIGMGQKGDGLGYRYIMQPVENGGDNGIYFQGFPLNSSEDPDSNPYPNFYDFVNEFNDCTDEGGIVFKNGKKPTKFLTQVFKIIDNDKYGTYMDYFAGSSSSGHTIIKSNRLDEGSRKYILVEMGTYFNNATKPRIQKVIYTDNWKNGKPQDKAGISQIFKYQVLESYEDVLNNLQLANKTNESLLNFEEQAQEEYLLNYMLDVETQDHLFNVQMFRNPFNYQLKVTENNELVPTKVDLVETFNYLIGLYVEHIQRVGDIKFVEGKTREGIKTLVIWRNLETTSNEETAQRFRKIYDSVRSSEFDQIYINGDHHFDNMRTGEDTFKVKLIEETFFKQMFNISEL